MVSDIIVELLICLGLLLACAVVISCITLVFLVTAAMLEGWVRRIKRNRDIRRSFAEQAGTNRVTILN